MDDLAQQRLDDFLNQVSDRTPTPGGGSVAAAAGALSCAMARMVAAYSVGKKTDNDARECVQQAAGRLRTADEILRALITQDAAAYSAMTANKPTGSEPPPNRDDTVMGAVAVPMEIAAVATRALAAMDDFKTLANRHLLCDLGIAAVLAEATARAARYTVQVNVAELSDPALRARLLGNIDAMIQRSTAHGDSIQTLVRDHLENGSGADR